MSDSLTSLEGLEATSRARSLAFGSLAGGAPPRERSGRARLLRNLYRALSSRPDRVLALQPTAPLNLYWRIAETPALTARLLVIRRIGLPDVVVALDGNTIADVRDALLDAGVELEYATEDATILTLSALALIPGSGEKWQSNGNHIYARRSLLWAWADAVGRWVDQARADIAEMLRMLVVRQSGDFWSEYWASFFGLSRKPGEPDARLNFRTEWEWRRPRSNPKAMELNIRHLLDQTVTVREPWREMMVVSGSVISGDHHLPNEEEYAYHRAQLRSREVYDWAPAMTEAEADRPASTLLIDPVTLPWPWIVEGVTPTIDFGGDPTLSVRIQDFDGHIISVNWDLSNSFYLLNPTLAITDQMDFISEPLADLGDLGARLTFCRGEIIVSEQWPLGDLQQHLSGRMQVEHGGGLVLSDSGALSDYEHRLTWQPVDEWLLDERAFDPPETLTFMAQPGFGPEQSAAGAVVLDGGSVVAGTDDVMLLTLPAAYDTGWRGGWTRRSWAAGYPQPSLIYTATQTLPDGSGAQATSAATASLSVRTQFVAQATGQASSASASLTTAIRLAATASAEASHLATFAPPARMQGAGYAISIAGAATTILAAANGSGPANSSEPANRTVTSQSGGITLTTGIHLAGTLAAGGQAPAPVLTTQIRLQAQASARTTAAATFPLPLLEAAAGAAGSATASLTTRGDSFAFAGAVSTPLARLQVGARMVGQTAASSGAGGALFVQSRFAGQAQGQATATAALRQDIWFGAFAQASAQVLSADCRPWARLFSVGVGNATAAASLRTAAGFAASAGAASAATSALTTGTGTVQPWPATNRSWLFDPDETASRTVVSGAISQLTDVGGGGRTFTQATAANRPLLSTFNNRGFLDIDSKTAWLDSDATLLEEIRDAPAVSTYHIVWRTGAVVPAAFVPMLSAYTPNSANSASILGVNSSLQPSSLVRDNGTFCDQNGTQTPAFAPNTIYLLTFRRNADGQMDFFVDGTLRTRLQNDRAVPSWLKPPATASHIGNNWVTGGAVTLEGAGSGYLGAVLRYSVAQTDQQISNMAAVKATRYAAGGSGSGAPETLFGTTAPASYGVDTGTSAVALGTRIRISQAGQVTHLRWFRPNTTQSVASLCLWNSAGTQIASVTPSGISGTGWKEVALPTPVNVTAGLYTVSYFTSNGNFATSASYFSSARVSGSLTGVATGSADGPNGVYLYGSTHNRPTSSIDASCYFADLTFVAGSGGTPPDEEDPPPNGGTTYSLWASNPTPSAPIEADTNDSIIGTRINVSQAGSITHVRFYRGSTSMVPVSVKIWNKNQAVNGNTTAGLLKTVSVSGTSGTGWKEVALDTPLAVAAGTQLLVSLYSTGGRYPEDEGYFNSARTVGPLTAPADQASDANGRWDTSFNYSNGSSHPYITADYNASAYYVDIKFLVP